MALWFLAGLARRRRVKISSAVLTALGVDRFARYRGLKALEEAGLVGVERRVGCNPVVTILEAEETD